MRLSKGEGMIKKQILRELTNLYRHKGQLTIEDVFTYCKRDNKDFDEIIEALAYQGLLTEDFFEQIDSLPLDEQIDVTEMVNDLSVFEDISELKNYAKDTQELLMKEKHFSSKISVHGNDSIGIYLKEIGQVNLLKPEEEYELAVMVDAEKKARLDYQKLMSSQEPLTKEQMDHFQDIFRKADFAKSKLIESNLRLVFSIAKKYNNSGMHFLDIIQEGNMGLMKAVEKFDFRKGNKFSTYATWWIRQAITRAIADQSRTIRIPVHMVETINTMLKTQRSLVQKLKREPTDQEVAFAMNVTADKIQAIKKIAQDPLSLEKPIGEEEDSSLGDLIADGDVLDPMEYASKEALIREINQALSTLTDREEQVIRLRFGLWNEQPKTLEEVGHVFQVTRERIRQIESKAIQKLRSQNQFELIKYYAELQ